MGWAWFGLVHSPCLLGNPEKIDDGVREKAQGTRAEKQGICARAQRGPAGVEKKAR